MQRCSGHNQNPPNWVASTRLAACKAVALGHAPDGGLYFSDVRNLRIRAIRPDGIIETVAGTGEKCVASGPSDYPDNPPEAGCDEGPAATSGLGHWFCEVLLD